MNEDDIITPSQSRLFGPRMAEMGASDALGLNHLVWRRSVEFCVVGSFSLVT